MRISTSSLYSQLNRAQRGAFRKTRSRLMKKGYSSREADLHAAKLALRHLPQEIRDVWLGMDHLDPDDVELVFAKKSRTRVPPRLRDSWADDEPDLQTTARPKDPTLPTTKQVQDLVAELKEQGVMVETKVPMLACASSLIKAEASTPVVPAPPRPIKPKPDLTPKDTPNLGIFMLQSVIVLGATMLLTTATAEIYGNDWQGWAQALLLECGIIALILNTTRSRLANLFSKASLAFLVGLSFYTLYSGFKVDQAKASTQVQEIENLDDLRQRLIANHDALPQSHISKKQQIIGEIEAIDAKKTRLENLRSNTAPETLHSQLFMRAALLLLNLAFAHSVANNLGTVWNQIVSA